MKKVNFNGGLGFNWPLLNLITVILGVAAAYFMTIQSLKIELAEKAEEKVVETIDKKLINLEVILKEGVVNKEEFFEFSKNIENRLTRIEYYLIDQTGEKIGRDKKLSKED